MSDHGGWREALPMRGPGPYRVVAGRIHTNALEINVVDHCNLRCRSCSHLSPITPEYHVDPDDLQGWLAGLARLMRVEEVRLLGGEPSLHPDLDAIVRVVRDSYISATTTLITNGLQPGRISDTVMAGIDLLRITSYPASRRRVDALLDQWRSKCRQSATRLEVRASDFFRFTLRPPDDSLLTERIFSACQMAHDWRCLTLGAGQLYLCPQAYAFNRAEILSAGSGDGLVLGPATTIAEVLGYLERRDPLPSCAACTGTFGVLHPHEQIASRDFLAGEDAAVDAVQLARIEATADRHSGRVGTQLIIDEAGHPDA